MYYTTIGISIAFAILWYRAGDLEASMGGRNPATIWALSSLALSLFVFLVLRAGVVAVVFAQLLLFVGISIVRAVRDSR